MIAIHSLCSPFLAAGLGNPIPHVTDKPLFGWYISNATVMLVLAAVVTAALIIPAARRIATGQSGSLADLRARGPFANAVEFICLLLRDDFFRPLLGDQTDRYAPVLWTFFWFILVNNLLGLLPLLDFTALIRFGFTDGPTHGLWGTATQSIWVTAGLAVTALVFWTAMSIKQNGIGGYLHHFTAGTEPGPIWLVMIPVEIVGTIVKPFALALRLFANMTAGHILLAVMYGFIVSVLQLFSGALTPVGYAIAVLPFLGAIAINLLEILVAFIQAFVFTYLTCAFLAQQVAHEHSHEEPHDVAPGHAPEPNNPHAVPAPPPVA